MEPEKTAKGQKAEGKEEIAQEQNREIGQRMGVDREKAKGAGKEAWMIKHSHQHNRYGQGGSIPPLPNITQARINLKVLLPFRIFAEKTGVTRIVAETRTGAFGLLPHRLDCVAALAPGILIYENDAEGEVFVAINEGVLVKTGLDVLISVRDAISGTDLSQLRLTVEQEFLHLNEREQGIRAVMAKIESGFIRRLEGFHHE